MIDKPFRQVDSESAYQWAANECVKLYEVSAKDRSSLLELVFDIAAQRFRPIGILLGLEGGYRSLP